MLYRDRSRFTFPLLAVGLALAAALVAMLGGFGNRRGWWDFRTGISILKWAAYSEIVVIAASAVGMIIAAFRRRKAALAYFLIGAVISIAAIGVPLAMWITAHQVPPIHDITTDTENPPRFVEILKARRDAPNTSEYGGPDVAARQHAAYPDIKPLIFEMAPGKAFDLASDAASGMGWEIVNKDPAKGIIEATDTTFWFGFKDDIIIRVTPDAKGSRIDVRSVSRVGVSDIGTNAKRIRKYLKVLQGITNQGTR